jgi:hypothetical protein
MIPPIARIIPARLPFLNDLPYPPKADDASLQMPDNGAVDWASLVDNDRL